MGNSKRNWTLNRRTALKGIGGVSLGLPWMETMLWATAKKDIEPAPLRLGVIYQPNGINPYEWTPEGTGDNYKLSKTLRPLEPIRDEVLVLTNLFTSESTIALKKVSTQPLQVQSSRILNQTL